MRLFLIHSALLLGFTAIACYAQQPAAEPANSDSTPQRIDARYLPNAFRLHSKVISGGLPEGEAAFQELEALGVKTVISVDGAKPDLELAKQHGMRYVHLPHGYDGISEDRAKELSKAVRDLPGPIYIHCHHGKHRSPAAATVACVSVGFLQPQAALGVLKAAGTSENSRGLYRAAQSARRLDDALLDELKSEFPESVEIPPLAQAMVEIEHVHDRLKQIAKSGWKSPPDHPDLDPAHEALLLREHYTELLRTKESTPAFQDLLRDSETAAADLEAQLGKSDAGADRVKQAAESLDRITKNCTACHQQFRDNPR